MLPTELETQDIPAIYARFAKEIGEKHWQQRVKVLNEELRGNPFLKSLHFHENAIAFQLVRLGEMRQKFGQAALPIYNDEQHYQAASFAAQVLSVIDASNRQTGERLKRRIHGAFKNPAEMRAMQLELMTATHFLRAGRKVSWPEMTDAPEVQGVGKFDLLVEDVGPDGLEIECKSISDQRGRRITSRQALDFYGILRKRHWERIQRLSAGVLIVITVPNDLPKEHKERLRLADAAVRRALHCVPGKYEDEGVRIQIGEFESARLRELQTGVSKRRARDMMDEISGTRNKEVMAVGTKAGGALALVIQSAQDDDLMDSMFDMLRDSAARQFSGSRAAIFVVGLDGIDADQLLNLAHQDRKPDAIPTALRWHTSRFFESTSRAHITGITFLSANALRPVNTSIVDSGGLAYYFPRIDSKFWSKDFHGLFGQDPEPKNVFT